MATIYETIKEYLMGDTDSQTKMDRYNSLQEALELQLVSNAAGQEFDSYELDDGQSKIKTVIKDYSKIIATIDAIEKLKERLFNNTVGNVVVLRDAKAVKSLKNGY